MDIINVETSDQDFFKYVDISELQSLLSSYETKNVPRSTSSFTDKVWQIIDDGANKHVPLYFEDFENYPTNEDISLPKYKYLIQFLKIHTFNLLNEKNYFGKPNSARTIRSRLSAARTYLIPLLINNDILVVNDCSPIAKIKSASSLSGFDIDALVEDILALDMKESSKSDILLGIAEFLKERTKIPYFYRIMHNPFKHVSIRSFLNVDNNDEWDEKSGFQVIPDTEYYWLGQSAINFVHDHSDTILRILDITNSVLQQKIPKDFVRKQRYPSLDAQHRGFNPTDWRLLEIAKRISSDKTLTLPKWSKQQTQDWDIPNVTLPKSLTSEFAHLELHENGFNLDYLYGLFRILFGACAVLILIPTGIRASEFANLSEKRIYQYPNADGIYTYLNGIKKIPSPGKFTNDNEIPIPYETWNAMHVLARLTKPIRGDDPRLFYAPLNRQSVGSAKQIDDDRTVEKWQSVPMFPNSLNRYLNAFATFIRCKVSPTTHQFRKTLANFFISHTIYAPILLCQLFGHKSLAMTLKYLNKSKLIKREIAERVTEKFGDTVAELATAYITDTLAGPMKEVFHKAIESTNRFKGLTEDELALDLRNWILEKMKYEKYMITHTPVSLCCRQKTAQDTPPCHTGNCTKVAKEFPLPADCVGAECQWALFTFKNAKDISSNLSQYQEVIKSVGIENLQGQYIRNYATNFYETYDPILKQIITLPAKQVEKRMKVIFQSKA
ncbi:site-specific integrase [Vibrio diazotrophicus]|uniref:site-specific integrase n=1 Tax=Vibrio diazotrophicus TaxID=685 RepID=UPI000C9EA007|nr:site-specific integrase [Vibrio diazotrophicus]PNH83421.1 hypothetical protein C1N27_02260 [Vibrio diazotrophicus]